MDANFTNTITNLLHASFLFLYFILACRNKLSKDIRIFFFLIFSAKIFGALVHYTQNLILQDFLWLIISVQICLINYVSARIINIKNIFLFLLIPTLAAIVFCLPSLSRIIGIPLMLNIALYFPLDPQDFTYMAIAILWISLAASFTTRSLVRLGFFFTFLSNMVWIISRKFLESLHNGFLPSELRYDNDLYHVLLIVSTYVLFKGLKNKQLSL